MSTTVWTLQALGVDLCSVVLNIWYFIRRRNIAGRKMIGIFDFYAFDDGELGCARKINMSNGGRRCRRVLCTRNAAYFIYASRICIQIHSYTHKRIQSIPMVGYTTVNAPLKINIWSSEHHMRYRKGFDQFIFSVFYMLSWRFDVNSENRQDPIVHIVSCHYCWSDTIWM